MKLLHYLQYIIIALPYVSPIAAQVTVKGTVTCESNREAVYASIRLLRPDSTLVQGTVTDSIGRYRLPNVSTGNYLLAVSSIGYIPQWYAFSAGEQDKELPLLKLKEDNVRLDEVTVNASSIIRQKDRVLIIPEAQQVKHASTGYDLLYNLMIPGISVDVRRGSVSTLFGQATLYINGQKADYKEIRALRPEDIEKVEYFEMPTGKYIGDKASINYILKERTAGGYVTLDGTQTIGYLEGDYNAGAKIMHKRTSYMLYAGHSMEHSDGIRTDKEETFRFPAQEINRTTHADDAGLKKNSQYVQLNINNSNDKRTLAGKLSFVRQDMPESYNSSTMTYTDTPMEAIRSHSRTTQTGLMPSMNLYGNFRLGEKQHLETNLTATYTNNDYTRRYEENEASYHTEADEDLYNINFSANYNLQLKHNNSFGLNMAHLHLISSSHYQGDFNDYSHLWTAETLLMGQYNQNLGKVYFSLQFGGDLLQYRLHGNEMKRFLSPHANVLLNYRMKPEHTLMYGLHTGNSNPPMEWMSNVNQDVDFLTVKRGNPNLDKTNYCNSYLVYTFQKKKINLQMTGFYFGAINNVSNDYYVENDKLVNSFRSGGNYHQLRASMAVTYKITPALHVMLSGFYRHNQITGKVEAYQNEWGGKININYYWKDLAFNAHGTSAGKTLENSPVFIKTPANYGIFIRWKRNNWMAEAGTDNTFSRNNRNVRYINTDVYRFHNSSYSRKFQQTGYAKVAYTFDFGKKTSQEQRKINTNINSGILKAE